MPPTPADDSASTSSYPLTFRVRQHSNDPVLADPAAEVEGQLATLRLQDRVRPGHSVAIAAGSRGIANISTIIKAVVAHIRGLGGEPFIVPAMGSHGGGTAAGQQRILESYGITEAFCGAPIRASMETVVVCEAAEGFPVHFDKHAHGADHVVVCNRIKPHTEFDGEVQSGLLKMLLIGLGKHAGARIYHRAIQDYSFPEILERVTNEVLARCNILAGVAIVENRDGGTAQIEAIEPQAFATREPQLLALARQWMPRLPFDSADILLIDEVGKNISGTGFDVTVAGRKQLAHRAGPDERPKIKMIALRALTAESHGNAEGMGLAEFCRTRLLDRADLQTTRINSLTSGSLIASMLPIALETDRELLDAMLPQIGLREPARARMQWIQNTELVAEAECSAAYLEEARGRDDLEVLSDPRPLQFDLQGNLPDRI